MLLEPEDTTEAASIFPSGKDEMNFAEHPIALLTDRVPKGQKSIKFEDTVFCEKRQKLLPRKRVIEGSAEYGLPTATDDTVILALIQLTKQKSDFTNREVEFTRLELIRLLGWPNEGKSYDRIKRSLLRIKGVSYSYDNAWWDARLKMWTTRAFNIIDNVEINDSRAAAGQNGLFPSRISWNHVVFESFQTGFLRNIDFQLCIRLEHPTALRIYRFLGKRFYVRPDWTFDLKDFASRHMAMGEKYEGGKQIARKLGPAIEELVKVGFLEPLAEGERFIKKGQEWSVRFVQKSPAPPLPANDQEPLPSPLMQALAMRGVTAKVAGELVKRYPAKRIQAKLDVFDWMVAKKDKRLESSPAGYLVTSINDDYAEPKGFVSRAEQERQAEAKRRADQKAIEVSRRVQAEAAREQAELAAVVAYRKSLTPEQLASTEAEAIAAAADNVRQSLDIPAMSKFRKSMVARITDEFIRAMLARRAQTPAKK
jgi:hypothetical protein